jgi:hypothetical protein
MYETRDGDQPVTAAHFPAPRLPALVRARWHGPPVLVAAGVATPVAPERGGH